MMEHLVRIAHHAVASGDDSIVTVGLCSCVAIAVHDVHAKVGGLAHVLLPDMLVGRSSDNRAKYASTAVPLLLADMRAIGAQGPFVAKIAGGARLFGDLLGGRANGMGPRNVDAVRAALAAAEVPIAAEDVGGESGRSVRFDVASGAMTVRTVRGGAHVL